MLSRVFIPSLRCEYNRVLIVILPLVSLFYHTGGKSGQTTDGRGRMETAFKAGYAAMLVWFYYLVHSIQHMDAWNDDNRGAIAIGAAFAGLVVFPLYFALVYWIGRIKK